MDPRTKRLALTVGGTFVFAFTLFCVSVAAWGSWWRFDGMPTPEEWSALFGASALVALAFAWYQIRQVDQSNRELIASNEVARQVNVELVRPRVQVTFDSRRIARKERGAPLAGTVFLAVENIGTSPALDVRLSFNTPFTALEEHFNPGMMALQMSKINSVFDGTVSFETLNPGKKYIWSVGKAPEFFDEDNALPRKWEVKAEYRGTTTRQAFRETLILDRDLERHLQFPIDPLERIGKDLENIGKELEGIKGTSHGDFTFLGGVISETQERQRTRNQRSPRGTRRLPRWTRR